MEGESLPGQPGIAEFIRHRAQPGNALGSPNLFGTVTNLEMPWDRRIHSAP